MCKIVFRRRDFLHEVRERLNFLLIFVVSGAHNEERKGRGKEREAPTHLIEISELSDGPAMLHALLKIGITARYVAKKNKWLVITMKLIAHNSSVRDA